MSGREDLGKDDRHYCEDALTRHVKSSCGKSQTCQERKQMKDNVRKSKRLSAEPVSAEQQTASL